MAFASTWPTAKASNFGTKLRGTVGSGKQDEVIGKMARNARDIAKVLAPHGVTGNLARSVYARKASDGVWEVGSPMEYAWAVEFGSGIFGTGPTATGEPIEPKRAEFLAFKIGGEWVRVRYVLGQHPQPFIRPAVAQVDGKKEFSEMFK